MSLRPEAGEDDAREDDGSDLQHHREAGVKVQGGSNNSFSNSHSVRDDLDLESEAAASDKQVTSQEEETRSIESLQDIRTQDSSAQLVEGTQSADGTSSIPDDTPSLQVSRL